MKRSLVAAMLVVAAVAASAPASAQTSSGLVDIEDESGVDSLPAAASAAQDVIDGLLGGFNPGDIVRDALGNEPSAEAEAEELRTFLNDNSQSIVDHTNSVIDEYNASVADDTYVVETTIQGDDESATLYVIATGNGSQVTDYRVVNASDKSVDYERELSAFEAEDLNEDIREYHDRFVTTGDIPERGYYISMAAKYGLAGGA